MTLVTECSDGLGAHHGADRVAEPRRRERVAEAFIAADVEHGVDLLVQRDVAGGVDQHILDRVGALDQRGLTIVREEHRLVADAHRDAAAGQYAALDLRRIDRGQRWRDEAFDRLSRSEEHTSELQSLMRISYAVLCLTKQTKHHRTTERTITTLQAHQ